MTMSDYQREQIRKAAEQGKYKGRTKGTHTYPVKILIDGWKEGKSVPTIAKECGVSRGRVYARLKELRNAGLLPEREGQ